MPEGRGLLRLPKPPDDFTPDGFQARWLDFRPSSEDEAEATRRGKPVRVSVWDEQRTTIAQARTMRGVTRVIVLRLQVTDAVSVGSRHGAGGVRAVYDPLVPPANAQPGADGHAGIEGLDRRKGQPRPDWKALLEEIAKSAQLVAGP